MKVADFMQIGQFTYIIAVTHTLVNFRELIKSDLPPCYLSKKQPANHFSLIYLEIQVYNGKYINQNVRGFQNFAGVFQYNEKIR